MSQWNVQLEKADEKIEFAAKNGFYATMYGETYRPGSEIIKIEPGEATIRSDGALQYIWGWPGPDYNIYSLESYGWNWALTKEELRGEKTMKYDIKCELPFSWCRACEQKSLQTEKMLANGKVCEIETFCENAKICETMVKAMQEETSNMIPQSVRTAQQTSDGLRRLNLRLEAVLTEPWAILDGEKCLAEVERQLREGMEQAIRDLREKGWPGGKSGGMGDI